MLHLILSILELLENFSRKIEVDQFSFSGFLLILILMEMRERIKRPKKLLRIDKDTDFLISFSNLCAIKKKIFFFRSFFWAKNRSSAKGSYYFKWFSQKNRKPWFHKFDLKHRSMMSLNRLKSGHTYLAESSFRHKIIDFPCVVSIQSPNHVF